MYNLKIRLANSKEINWINEKYDEIGFQHVAIGNELIAVAELETQKIGMGRLIRFSDNDLELSGIYVLEPYRGKGIAKKIIEFLIEYRNPNDTIYCLPFSKVKELYKQFGFIDCIVNEKLPKHILDKCDWCAKSHQAKFDVLYLNSNQL